MASDAENLVGEVFGKLTVREQGRPVPHTSVWWCDCTCGGEIKLTRNKLLEGRVKSCGCLRPKPPVAPGLPNQSDTRSWRAWRRMIVVCTKITDPAYPRYGGRGIKVDTPWLTFEGFLADMGERTINQKLIRLDDTKGFSKANCRWAEK